jgi:hypothetical protein
VSQQHRRDHEHHARRKAQRHRKKHPDSHGSGEDEPMPGGPLMMTRNRTLMIVVSSVLVVGLIFVGVVLALAWT